MSSGVGNGSGNNFVVKRRRGSVRFPRAADVFLFPGAPQVCLGRLVAGQFLAEAEAVAVKKLKQISDTDFKVCEIILCLSLNIPYIFAAKPTSTRALFLTPGLFSQPC
jgi:hypothetical protein